MNDITNKFEQKDVENNKGKVWLAYFGILAIIPILTVKNSPFAKFHINQGLIILIIALVCGGITWIVNMLGIPAIGLIIYGINSVNGIFAIIGIVNCLQGKAVEFPLIGKIKIYQ